MTPDGSSGPAHDWKLFFFHTPKAGGTSVARAIGGLFDPAERCPLIENDERGHEERGGDYTSFRGYRFYNGHYGRDVFDAVSDGHRPLGNFRDPATRLLSLYNYYRVDVPPPDTPEARDRLYPVHVAQTVDFRAFVESDDPRIELLTRDAAAGSHGDPVSCRAAAVDLDAAMALLERMPWFYVCEEPERSAAWHRHVFGPAAPAIGREHVTSRTRNGRRAVDGIDRGTRALIAQKTRLDRALHDRAIRLLSSPERRGAERRWARRVFSRLWQ